MLTIKMQPHSQSPFKNLFDITTCDEVRTVCDTDDEGTEHIMGVMLVWHANESRDGKPKEQNISLIPGDPGSYHAVFIENPHGRTVAAYFTPPIKDSRK